MYAQHNLQAAINFSALHPGTRFFPAYWNQGHKPLVSWSRESSADPNQLAKWFNTYTTQGKLVYFCIATNQSGLTCIDLDNKGGKSGSASLQQLEQVHGALPPTLVTKTPTAGYHCWYTGASKVSFGKIGNGIDTPVMAPVPGSMVPGKGAYQVVNPSGLNITPQWVQNLAGIMKDKDPNREQPLCEWDLDHNIRHAIQILQKARPVVQGDNADAKTYALACYLRDKGISMGMAVDLMLEHWYPRCSPNNKPAFVERKADNAYRYANGRAGSDTPEAHWQPPANTQMFTSASELVGSLPRVDWTIKGLMESETVNLWFAPSNTYKSFLAIDASMAVATGQPFAGRETKQGLTFYMASEGRGGLSRRMIAASMRRKLSPEQLRNLYVGNYTVPLDNEAGVAHLIDKIREFEIMAGRPALIVIDTLAASFGGGDENSTKDMNNFVGQLVRIREQLGCAILVIHHSGLGTNDRSRGSSVLEAGVDSVARISRVENEPYMCLHSPKKMKDGEPPPDIYFRVNRENLGTNEDGELITSLSIEHDPEYKAPAKAEKWGQNQNIIQEILIDQQKSGENWVDEGFIWDEFLERYEKKKGKPFNSIRRNSFNSTLRTMGIEGKITLKDGLVSLGKVDPGRAAVRVNQVSRPQATAAPPAVGRLPDPFGVSEIPLLYSAVKASDDPFGDLSSVTGVNHLKKLSSVPVGYGPLPEFKC